MAASLCARTTRSSVDWRRTDERIEPLIEDSDIKRDCDGSSMRADSLRVPRSRRKKSWTARELEFWSRGISLHSLGPFGALIVVAICQVSPSVQQLIIRGAGAHESRHQPFHSNYESAYQTPQSQIQFSPMPKQDINSVPVNMQSDQLSSIRSQPATSLGHHSSNQVHSATDLTEARGPFLRNSIYSQSSLLTRAARNATSNGSWHFPRFSPEQAAEILIQGAQVINRIAQAETTLNYCKTPDNQEGECSDIRKCIWLVLDKARLKQSVCLRNLVIPAVCCPLAAQNTTPIANMLQSTLEPVLFRPKQPKQRKPQLQIASQMRPLSSIMNKTVIGSPPPGPASLVIRQPSFTNSTNNTANPHQHFSLSGHQGSYVIEPSTNSPGIQIHTALTSGITVEPNTGALDKDQASTRPSSNAPVSSTPFTLFQSDDDDHISTGPSKIPTQNPHTGGYNRTLGQKYPWSNETCGEGGRTRTSRIVGGTDSKLGQWPWMTAMYLNKKTPFIQGAGEFWCGGALINKRFILTAAHCLSDQRGNKYRNDQVTIKLGGIDLVRHQAPTDMMRNAELDPPVGSQMLTFRDSLNGIRRRTSTVERPAKDHGRSEEDAEFSWTSFITKALGLISGGGGSPSSPEGPTKSLSSQDDQKKQLLAAHAKKTYFKEYRVANIKQHPKFQRHGFYNDIGLIELKSDVDYDDLISPICLPNEHDLKRDMSGYMATVLGWGTLSYGGQGSKMLQQVSMPIWENKDCDERYLQHIGKTFLCAGFLTGGKDACQGDSGGPLMVGDKTGRWTLHGVVSFGKTCAQAGYPGVYTRVTEYLDWIYENTNSSGYI